MERKSMIKVRGGFSDRAGIDPCNIQMQIDDFDERTRTFISNKLYDFLQVTFNHECETRNIKYGPTDQNLSNIFCKNLMQNVFADLNHLPLGYHYDWEKFYSRIEEVLMEAPYNEVLDLLWYICNWFALSTNNCIDVFQEWFNELFQSEYVGYRFISGEIVPITDEIEVKEIEQACCTPLTAHANTLRRLSTFYLTVNTQTIKTASKKVSVPSKQPAALLQKKTVLLLVKQWANGAVNKDGSIIKSGSFKKLFNGCNFPDESRNIWYRQYQYACLTTHASPQGTMGRIALRQGVPCVPIGQTDYGIDIPAKHAARSLALESCAFFSVCTYGNNVTHSIVLNNWADLIDEATDFAVKEAFKDPNKTDLFDSSHNKMN